MKIQNLKKDSEKTFFEPDSFTVSDASQVSEATQAKKRGGKRVGAGRPLKNPQFGKQCQVPISFRSDILKLYRVVAEKMGCTLSEAIENAASYYQ